MAKIEKNQYLVKYIQANAEELIEHPIVKEHGIDLLVENNTIQHSHTPDVCLATLGINMKKDGKMLIGSSYSHISTTKVERILGETLTYEETKKYKQTVKDGFRVGFNFLENTEFEIEDDINGNVQITRN